MVYEGLNNALKNFNSFCADRTSRIRDSFSPTREFGALVWSLVGSRKLSKKCRMAMGPMSWPVVAMPYRDSINGKKIMFAQFDCVLRILQPLMAVVIFDFFVFSKSDKNKYWERQVTVLQRERSKCIIHDVLPSAVVEPHRIGFDYRILRQQYFPLRDSRTTHK